MNPAFSRGLGALLAYFLMSCALTWPLAVRLKTSIFGDYGDARGGLWWLWAKTAGLLDSPVNGLIAAPFGVVQRKLLQQPISDGYFLLPAYLFGEIGAHNLANLLAFPLTAFAAYLFHKKFLNSDFPAFFAGIVFGFCPAAVMQAVGGHASYSLNVFIPLFIWALFYNRSRRSPASAALVGASYGLLTLSALYFGYFAIFVTLFFVAYDLLSRGRTKLRLIAANYGYCAIFAAFAVLPFQYRGILERLGSAGSVALTAGSVRGADSLVVYSARAAEYLMPSINHPFLGKIAAFFFRDRLHGSNLFEQTLYLGFSPVLLCLSGFFIRWAAPGGEARRRHFLLFATAALWTILLAMPPTISFGNLELPMASYFGFLVLPMIRVYARFGVWTSFFLGCTCAVVLSELMRGMERRRFHALAIALVVALAFEYWSVSGAQVFPLKEPPMVYRWLAEQEGDIIVAEYPMMRSDEASFYNYLFWQRVHKKRLVNGATMDSGEAWDFYRRVANLADPDVPDRLRKAGVKYVIVHGEMYGEGEIPGPLKRYHPQGTAIRKYEEGTPPVNPRLSKAHRIFGNDVVYAL